MTHAVIDPNSANSTRETTVIREQEALIVDDRIQVREQLPKTHAFQPDRIRRDIFSGLHGVDKDQEQREKDIYRDDDRDDKFDNNSGSRLFSIHYSSTSLLLDILT